MAAPERWVAEIEQEADIVTAMAKDHALRDEEYADMGVLRMYRVEEPSVVLAYRTSHDDLQREDIAYTRAMRDGDNILCREDDFLYSLTFPISPGERVSETVEDVGDTLADALTAVTAWTEEDLQLDPLWHGPRYVSHGDWEAPAGTPDGPLMIGNSPWWGRNRAQVQGLIPYRTPDVDELQSYFHIPGQEEEAIRKFPGVEEYTRHGPDSFFDRFAGELAERFTGRTLEAVSGIEYGQLDEDRFEPSAAWVRKNGGGTKRGDGYCLLSSEQTGSGDVIVY
ncbi:MAG: hypothetical protein SVW77_03885 [Candidatus Nanohaloarchaea archaeon]|nr:hypothetical protein [Candidatus Nanohaloarchaea archaeon]